MEKIGDLYALIFMPKNSWKISMQAIFTMNFLNLKNLILLLLGCFKLQAKPVNIRGL